jgi:tRNA A37 threonylcarbamoyladenosine biosynthesis protein TsaE
MIERTFICNGCGMRKEIHSWMACYDYYMLNPSDLEEMGIKEYTYGSGVPLNGWVINGGYCHRCEKKIEDFKKSLGGK